MPRQGLSSCSSFKAPLIWAFLAVALFSSLSWGACVDGYWTVNSPGIAAQFVDGGCEITYAAGCDGSWAGEWGGYYWTGCTAFGSSIGGSGDRSECPASGSIRNDGFCSCGQYANCYSRLHCTKRCSSQAEADSVYCALNPTAEGCVEEDVPSSCEEDYYDCMSLKGQWRKISSTATECASECNTCGSADVGFRNQQISICCQQGKAPPDSAVQCYMPANSGSGMTWSVRVTNQNEEAYSCGELSTADGEGIQENQALYKRFCIDGDRYEEQPDSNEAPGGGGGESSSSAEEQKTSFATELEGLEGLYGVLDTIRDTLVYSLTPATKTIRDCLLNWQTCTGMTSGGDTVIVNVNGDSSVLKLDTTLRRLIAPLIDSSLKIDSAQFKTLKSLDSLYKRGLVNDSDIVTAVRAVRGEIENMDSSVVRAVRGVRDGLDSIIDSLSYYRHRSDSILDTVLNGTGIAPGDTDGDGDYGGYDATSDSIGNSYIMGLGGLLDTALNDTAFDRIFARDSLLDSIPVLPSLDSMQALLDSSVQAQRTELQDTLQAAFDTLKDEFMLLNYDSLILSPLGMRVPNTNTCPEHCFSFDIGDGSGQNTWLGSVGTLDFGICRNLPGFSFDVLYLLRIIGRLLTAVFCIYIGMWFIAGRKN